MSVPRIGLLEQPAYEFHYDLMVRVNQLDYGHHLSHDSVISMAHEARALMFHTLGVEENNLGDDRTGVIIGDLAVSYHGEAGLFDRLRIDSHIGELGRSNFRVFQRIAREGSLIALVETGTIAFDYADRTIVPIPEVFKKALKRYRMAQIPTSNT